MTMDTGMSSERIKGLEEDDGESTPRPFIFETAKQMEFEDGAAKQPEKEKPLSYDGLVEIAAKAF